MCVNRGNKKTPMQLNKNSAKRVGVAYMLELPQLSRKP